MSRSHWIESFESTNNEDLHLERAPEGALRCSLTERIRGLIRGLVAIEMIEANCIIFKGLLMSKLRGFVI
jgi:hypothetical protein